MWKSALIIQTKIASAYLDTLTDDGTSCIGRDRYSIL